MVSIKQFRHSSLALLHVNHQYIESNSTKKQYPSLYVDEADEEEEDWEINDDNLDTIGSHPQAPGIEVVKKTEEQIALELEARMEEGYKSSD